MAFEWDDENLGHIAEHGLTRDVVQQVFDHDPVLYHYQWIGEDRWTFVGETDSLQVLLVIITERGHQMRVVTARPADRPLKRRFYQEKGEQHG